MYVTTSNLVSTDPCTAHITSNRNRFKIYGDSFYLKDKQNFEIELFNPNKISFLAKISLNGKPISNAGIVLKPGQRVFLERFIDTNHKFVFETYEVDNKNESIEAIKNNGLVEIKFYPEITNPVYITSTSSQNVLYTTTNSTTHNYDHPLHFGGTTVNNMSYSFSEALFENKNIETGRVEKGESSDQNFKRSFESFSSIYESIVYYNLLPESQKPVEIEKIRNYCAGCGNRVRKKTWKFCPSCGEKF